VSEPLAHQWGLLPSVQDALASVQFIPQNRVVFGSSKLIGDLLGSAVSIVGLGVVSGSMSLKLHGTPGQQN
jgi:hypothetical protein